MAFDPVSHASGFGAGQVLAENNAAHQNKLANIKLNGARAELDSAQDTSLALAIAVRQARDQNEVLEGEIANRWIPYAVTLNASLVAKRVERSVLIEALRKLDPVNVDAVSKMARQAGSAEYNSIEGEKLAQVGRDVRAESEEGRLDR